MHSTNDYQLNLDSQLELEQAPQTLFDRIKNGVRSVIGFIFRKPKVTIPIILILLTTIGVMYFLTNDPATPARRPNLTPPLTVSVTDITSKEFQVNVQSYGNIAPRTQSFLIAQVSGVVTEVGDNLREGSFFEKGDILLKIDDRDYLADIKISQANLAEAKQALSEELATATQAEDDWKRLGNTEPANDLVLRKPQLQAVRARVASAEAALAKAQLGLDRTQVVAPFSGRVLNKMIDLGQVTGSNSQIAEVYATDYVEIRLPIRDSDLRFVNLPEAYRGTGERAVDTEVKIYSSLSGSNEPWLGKIVRTESAIDTDSRQLHVVAQLDDPFGDAAVGRTPLKIGEYITAEIEGKNLSDAIVIPSSVIYQDTYVYVANGGVLERRDVQVLWRNKTDALIGEGLESGDRLVTTTLGQVASGTRVSIEGEAKPSRDRGNNAKQGERKRPGSDRPHARPEKRKPAGGES